MKLRVKAFQSGILLSVTTTGIRALRVGALIVLARLLQPADFGLLASAMVAVTGLIIVSKLGLFSALVASKQEKYKAAHHVFVMNSCMGLGVSLLLVFAAGPYADLYGEPILKPMCQIMALVVFFDSLRIAPHALLIKDMMFGRYILSTSFGVVAGAVVSILLAMGGAGVWSLVSGAVAASLTTLISLVVACPNFRSLYRPNWEGAVARQLLRFGTRSMASQIISYYYDNVDRFLVGKILGPAQLGFYQQAWNFALIPITTVSDISNVVLLPAYSRISDDKERLARAFISSFQLVSVLTIPMSVGIFVLAPEAIVVLLGEKWRETGSVVQVLALMSLVRPLSRTTSSLFLSLGFPQFNLYTALTQAVCATLFIVPGLRWGISGVALAITFAFIVGFAQNMYLTCKKTGLSLKFRTIVRSVTPIFISGTIMLIALGAIKISLVHYSIDTYNLIYLFLAGTSGVLVYAAATFIFDRRVVMDIVKLARQSLARKSAAYDPTPGA